MRHTLIAGRCDDAFAAVGNAFERCFVELGETGAGLCAIVDGRQVVDLWGGLADPVSGRAWRCETLVHAYSVSKPFAAICLLHLADRGAVDLDAPVARYWPEFGRAGKAEIPVRWLLTHQAGLVGLRRPLDAAAICDWDRIVGALADEEPWWEPGTRHGEHAWFYGHLVGEVVRRVSGKRIGAYLRDAIAGPWRIDFHFGLSEADAARCATVTGLDGDWLAERGIPEDSMYARALGNPPGLLDGVTVNSAAWRRTEFPAINGHGSARGVARLYAGLAAGGMLGGRRLLSPAMVARAISVRTAGVDLLLERPVSWGFGVQIEPDGFGMAGIGGSLGWGSVEHNFGFAYVTAHMADHDRAMGCYRALADTLGFAVDP